MVVKVTVVVSLQLKIWWVIQLNWLIILLNMNIMKLFLVQRLTEGFKKYGEVKSFWVGGEYSYAIVTKDVHMGFYCKTLD